MKTPTSVAVVLALICGGVAAAAADDLPFEIQNARQGGITDKLKTAADGTAPWTYTARIVVAGAGGEQDAKDLTARIDPLEAAGGQRTTAASTTATVAAHPDKLAPGQVIEVAITATFPAAGEYRGELLLYRGTVQRVVPIAIEVEAATLLDPPLVEHGRASIALTESWRGDAAATATIRVRNTGAHALKLGAPRVVAAKRVDKLDAPTRELQVAGAALAPREPPGALAGGDVATVPIAVYGLDAPGIYQLELLVPVADHAPKTFTVTVYRRKHWVRAVFWIALGVLIAYGVRRFVQGGKDRLKVRRTLAELQPRLAAVRDEATDPPHVAAALVLAAELEQRRRDARWQADGAALLATVERLVARVLLLGEIVAAARTVARLDAEAQVAPRTALDAALATVRVDPGADKAADIDEQRRTIAALAVDDAWRARLRAGTAELKDATAALEKSGGEAARAALRRDVVPALTKAQAALAADRLADTAALLEDVRARFLTVAIADLAARADDVPLGCTAADWPAVAGAVKNGLATAASDADWATRRQGFLDAQRAYFKAALGGLVAHATARAADTDDPPGDPARLTAIAAELTAELAAGDAGLDRAARLYATRRAEIERAAAPLTEIAPVSSGRGPADAAPWLALPGAVGERGRAPTPAPVRLLDATLRWTELAVLLAVLFIAVASGVKTLWLPDLSWGADGAALTAFLWGAGIGAAGDAFTGLIGLREKLGGTA